MASWAAEADVFNQTTALHTFTGTAKTDGTAISVPYTTGISAYDNPRPAKRRRHHHGASTHVGDHPDHADGVAHFIDGSTAAYHVGDGDVHALFDLVDSDLGQVLTALAKVGSFVSGISIQHDFNAALADALTSGVGSLVAADMAVAATRLQALQTQRRLRFQALSIANDNAPAVLRLFA